MYDLLLGLTSRAGSAKDYLDALEFGGRPTMCNTCIITLGSFVGAVALTKAGALGTAKAALLAFAASYLVRRR